MSRTLPDPTWLPRDNSSVFPGALLYRRYYIAACHAERLQVTFPHLQFRCPPCLSACFPPRLFAVPLQHKERVDWLSVCSSATCRTPRLRRIYAPTLAPYHRRHRWCCQSIGKQAGRVVSRLSNTWSDPTPSRRLRNSTGRCSTVARWLSAKHARAKTAGRADHLHGQAAIAADHPVQGAVASRVRRVPAGSAARRVRVVADSVVLHVRTIRRRPSRAAAAISAPMPNRSAGKTPRPRRRRPSGRAVQFRPSSQVGRSLSTTTPQRWRRRTSTTSRRAARKTLRRTRTRSDRRAPLAKPRRP